MNKLQQQFELAEKALIKDIDGNNIAQYNAEKIQVINNIKGSYGIDKKFFVGFCKAFVEIATSTLLGKIEMNLICFILGNMGNTEMMINKNKQILLKGAEYAKLLNTYQPHITKAFQTLEYLGYVERVTGGAGGINILINPDLATNASTKQYKDLRKNSEFQNLIPFEDEPKDNKEKQNWNSSVKL